MRDFKGMKRQRGRNRGGGGGQGGQGKPQQHNANRAFESNGPDGVKARGNAQHIFEKYQQLARDASSGGDRVLAESYLQHAEHYFRVIRAVQPNKPTSEIIGRDTIASGFDIDFEDENGAPIEAPPEPEVEASGGGEDRDNRTFNRDERPREFRDDRPRDRNFNRDDRPRDDRPRDDRPRDDRPRDDRPRDDRPRDDRPRDDRPRDDRPRDDRPRDDRPRDDRPRDDRPRDDRPRDDRPRNDRPRDDRPRDDRPRDDRPRELREDGPRRERDRPRREPAPDAMAIVEPSAEPLVAKVDAPAKMLRSEDGDLSHTPAFLRPRVAPKPDVEAVVEAPTPRAPRKRKVAAAVETDAGADEA